MSVATYAAAVAPSVSSRAGQRASQRHLGTDMAMAASAASGTNTTTAWMTSGWRGIPLNSMQHRLGRDRPHDCCPLVLRPAEAWTPECDTRLAGRGLTLCRMPSDYTDDLRLAHVLADDADSTSTARFKALDLHVMTKPDLTPVTDADQSVEEGIRRVLSRARPRDAVQGEETGSTGHSQRRWVVDPIDGTKNFVRGVPVWASLISLMVDDEVVVGVVSAPALNRRWWAMKDGGAWTGKSLLRATACQVSDVSRIEDASLSYSSLHGWDERGRLEDFLSLSRRCWRTRAYGDFWSYMLVAEGAVDIATEPDLLALRHGRARRDRARGRRSTSPRSTASRARRAAARWPPTASSTTRRWRSSARTPTTAIRTPGAPCTTSAPAAANPPTTPTDTRCPGALCTGPGSTRFKSHQTSTSPLTRRGRADEDQRRDQGQVQQQGHHDHA